MITIDPVTAHPNDILKVIEELMGYTISDFEDYVGDTATEEDDKQKHYEYLANIREAKNRVRMVLNDNNLYNDIHNMKVSLFDSMNGSQKTMTIAQLLNEINMNRSEDWTDYNEKDWKDGLEWTDYTVKM